MTSNNISLVKLYIFIVMLILKVFAGKDYSMEKEEIKYKNPFIYNITDKNFTEIVNKNDDSILRNFDTSILYVILLFVIVILGLKCLISIISRQIKEEMRNDYLLI
ncbi:hypothetical protein BCR36DRAFT_586969 [Piromyces finnis]|uniref:Uncharacterized protein n=1 Tax=Piromyces finnis TaxID=1754191 RepID=A0A1Y1UYT6_9FUNG|nr:hypothetical protein BCR36DRAFT_586969 [Piromyces finnis]|eukprot:ORX42821.1 hypothetical protein BCR36DRAFT_586969 [Piromyces finnis]